MLYGIFIKFSYHLGNLWAKTNFQKKSKVLLNRKLPPKIRDKQKKCWKCSSFFSFFALFFLDFVWNCLIFLFLNKNARKMPNLKKMPNENFPCQTLLKNANFVKSGIEKCQLAALIRIPNVNAISRKKILHLKIEHCLEKEWGRWQATIRKTRTDYVEKVCGGIR